MLRKTYYIETDMSAFELMDILEESMLGINASEAISGKWIKEAFKENNIDLVVIH